MTFRYDALGRRISRTVNGATTQFVHDSGRIVLELQGNSVTAVYSYGNSLVARNGEVVLADGLGTTRATVDGSQAVTGTLTTEAFGNPVAQWGSSANPYRFAGAWGYRDDGDAGLLHVGARYYDPQVGRFISRDAVLSEHPYLYCEDDPVNAVDPSGYKIEDAGDLLGGIGAIIGGGGLLAGTLPLPPVAGIGIAVIGIGAGIVGGIIVGDWIADHLLPPPDTYIPAPSDEELKRYRREIEEGWWNGTIPSPPGWNGHRIPPRAPYDPNHHRIPLLR